MDRPIRDHLFLLHQRIQELSLKVMDNCLTQDERNHVEFELRVAQEALDHYRKALELEHQIT